MATAAEHMKATTGIFDAAVSKARFQGALIGLAVGLLAGLLV